MKRRFLCGFAALCLLLCACGARTPQESSASSIEAGSAESVSKGEIQIPAEATALLDALLDGEGENGFSALREDGGIDWIAFERVSELRARVQAIGTPFLTEETVLRIARRVAAFYSEAAAEGRTIGLYGFDQVFSAELQTEVSYWEHVAGYNTLLAYTLYLLTPSKYVFSQLDAPELFTDGLPNDFDLYLVLAGHYKTRLDAVAALREERRCVVLHMDPSVAEATALHMEHCIGGCHLLSGEETRLLHLIDLTDTPESFFHRVNATEQTEQQLAMFLNYDSKMGYYTNLPSNDEIVFQPVRAEQLQYIRGLMDSVVLPLISVSDMLILAESLYEALPSDTPVFLPDPAGFGADAARLDPAELGRKTVAVRTAAYLLDLFTPEGYRFTALTETPGMTPKAFYAPQGDYHTPEEALAAFEAGETLFLLVTEDGDVYFADGSGVTEELLREKTAEESKQLLDMLLNYDGKMGYYTNLPTDDKMVFQPVRADQLQNIRELMDSTALPLISAAGMLLLAESLYEALPSDAPVFLPALAASGTDAVRLDPAVLDRKTVAVRAAAYFLDLFTPKAYRFTALTETPDVTPKAFYAPRGGYHTPEEALAAFEAGEMLFLLVTEDGGVYFVDGSGAAEELLYEEMTR